MAQVPSQKPKLGAQRGKKLHSIAEQFLLTAPATADETFIEFSERAGLWEHDLRHGIRSANTNDDLRALREQYHDPSVAVDILVEQEFSMEPVFMGFIDLIVLDRRDGDLKVTIHDHKFMANKSSVPHLDVAKTDYQTVIYAKAAIEFFSLDSVTFSYDYYGTKYKWKEILQFVLTRSEIDAIWLSVLGDTAKTLDNYKVPCGQHTTPNYFSCQNYGGCDYRDICFGELNK